MFEPSWKPAELAIIIVLSFKRLPRSEKMHLKESRFKSIVGVYRQTSTPLRQNDLEIITIAQKLSVLKMISVDLIENTLYSQSQFLLIKLTIFVINILILHKHRTPTSQNVI